MKEKHMPYNSSHRFCHILPHRQYSDIFVYYKSMNKGDLTNSNDNKAHARKGKSLVEFNTNYFSNLAENLKFTFYCQKLVFRPL